MYIVQICLPQLIPCNEPAHPRDHLILDHLEADGCSRFAVSDGCAAAKGHQNGQGHSKAAVSAAWRPVEDTIATAVAVALNGLTHTRNLPAGPSCSKTRRTGVLQLPQQQDSTNEPPDRVQCWAHRDVSVCRFTDSEQQRLFQTIGCYVTMYSSSSTPEQAGDSPALGLVEDALKMPFTGAAVSCRHRVPGFVGVCS